MVINLFAELILYLESILIAYGPLGVFVGSISGRNHCPHSIYFGYHGNQFRHVKGCCNFSRIFLQFLY